jgi:hypothetical protein
MLGWGSADRGAILSGLFLGLSSGFLLLSLLLGQSLSGLFQGFAFGLPPGPFLGLPLGGLLGLALGFLSGLFFGVLCGLTLGVQVQGREEFVRELSL